MFEKPHVVLRPVSTRQFDIFYFPARKMEAAEQMVLHFSTNQGSGQAQDMPMAPDREWPCWRARVAVPLQAFCLDVCFHDGHGHWESNRQRNWSFDLVPFRKMAMDNRQLEVRQLSCYQEMVKLLHDNRFAEEMRLALSNPFDVLVMATMSAGKSTLINAMLGQDLLPSKNEPCTAIVYRVEDNDQLHDMRCRAVVGEEIQPWREASISILEEWNQGGLCSLVEIEGNLENIRNRGAHLVIYDTPGPNNARDEHHGTILKNLLLSQQYGMILYMLNATQIAVDDDLTLLSSILGSQDGQSPKEIVFVLNKVDELDEDAGESLSKVIRNVRSYLKSAGFENPRIVPVMARAAKLMRMAMRGLTLTRREKGDLNLYLSLYEARPDWLIKHSDCSPDVRKQVLGGLSGCRQGGLNPQSIPDESGVLSQANYFTGIPTLEAMLEESICERAMPVTLNKVARVFSEHEANQLHQWIIGEQRPAAPPARKKCNLKRKV